MTKKTKRLICTDHDVTSVGHATKRHPPKVVLVSRDKYDEGQRSVAAAIQGRDWISVYLMLFLPGRRVCEEAFQILISGKVVLSVTSGIDEIRCPMNGIQVEDLCKTCRYPLPAVGPVETPDSVSDIVFSGSLYSTRFRVGLVGPRRQQPLGGVETSL